MKLTKIKRKELRPGDMFCVPYKHPVSEVYMVLREDMIDSLSNAEVLRIDPDDPKKAQAETNGVEQTLTTNLEDTTDKSLEELGVTEVHITHMKLPDDCYYSYITLATQQAEKYGALDIAVNTIFLEGSINYITGSALGALIVQRFAEFGIGASPCHAIDNFSRKRGRIIAKGRLLKHLKAAKQAVPEAHTEQGAGT